MSEIGLIDSQSIRFLDFIQSSLRVQADCARKVAEELHENVITVFIEDEPDDFKTCVTKKGLRYRKSEVFNICVLSQAAQTTFSLRDYLSCLPEIKDTLIYHDGNCIKLFFCSLPNKNKRSYKYNKTTNSMVPDLSGIVPNSNTAVLSGTDSIDLEIFDKTLTLLNSNKKLT